MLVCSLKSLETSAIFYVFHSQLPIQLSGPRVCLLLSIFPPCLRSCIQWLQTWHGHLGQKTHLLSVFGMVRKDTAVARLLKRSAHINKRLLCSTTRQHVPLTPLFSHLDPCNSLLTGLPDSKMHASSLSYKILHLFITSGKRSNWELLDPIWSQMCWCVFVCTY